MAIIGPETVEIFWTTRTGIRSAARQAIQQTG